MQGDASAAESHFRDWLRYRLCGCFFAARVGGDQDRVLFSELLAAPDGVDADLVESFFDAAGAQRRVGVLLCPRLRTDDEVAALVAALSRHPRWAIEVEPAAARNSSEVGFRMTWTTATGLKTNAMGFAPVGRMPVTRRAPYVALAAWTGPHENPLRRQRSEDEVTMGDIPPPVAPGVYRDQLAKTRDSTARLVADDEVAIEVLRRLAFRLSREAVALVLPPARDGSM